MAVVPLSAAQLRTLRLAAEHGAIKRVHSSHRTTDWSWKVGPDMVTRTAGLLLLSGHLQTVDRDTLELTPKGWAVVREAAE